MGGDGLENLSIEFWIQIFIYGITFGAMTGKMTTELKWMKEKLDKHNHFQDRLTENEARAKSAHHRLDEFGDTLKEVCVDIKELCRDRKGV